MTLCENCEKMMQLERVNIDFGEGDEEFEFEGCAECHVIYVYTDWKVRKG